MTTIHSRTAIAAALFIVLQPAFAASVDDEAAVLITATRLPVLLDHATGEVAVVGRKEIEARNSQRLTDVINLLPGVFVSSGKGLLQPTGNLVLRGIPDDRRTLLLLDGVPIGDGFTGSNNLGGLPVDNISQAEVLYGPMSSMFGGNAMGGVINFVTRMPRAPEFGFSIGYGDPFEAGKAPAAVKKASVRGGTLLENGLSMRVTANWTETDGYRGDWVTSSTNPAGTTGAVPITLKNGASGFMLGKKGENGWQENGASLKLQQKLSGGTRWQAGWQLQDYDYDYGRPETYLTAAGVPTYGATPSAQASFAGNAGGYSRHIYHAGFDTDLGMGHFNLLASYSDIGKNFTVTPLGGATSGPGRITHSPSHTVNLDAYWTAAFAAHNLTAGLAYRQDKADSTTYSLSNWADPATETAVYSQAAGKATLRAAYLQDEWRIAPQMTLQAGLRYDQWRNSDGFSLSNSTATTYAARTASAWSPKLGAAYRPSDSLTLRVSAGSAFRAPSIYDLYRSAKFSYSIVANPELKPETVRTLEAGGEWRPWQGGEVRLTFFDNDIRDLIYLQGSGSTRTRINAGRAESRGYAFAISHRFDADNRVFASLTHTSSEIKENAVAPASVGKQLTYLPEKQASLGFETRRGPLTWAASARYASKQYSTDDNSDVATHTYQVYDAYWVADAKLTYRIDRQLALSLAIDNLFDRSYFSYYPAPRRSWFAELKYQY